MLQKADIFVPPWKWGKDHHRLLVFVEHLCVDESGLLDSADQRMAFKFGDGFKPCRLSDGEEVDSHDDWDMLNDLQAWGYVNVEEAPPNYRNKDIFVSLTGRGWAKAHKLRRQRAVRG